ncbi:hypothetical protein Runsl_5121 [Runella slithyformis DSM 19594]|uniref:Uncharacterized protein n=1 Tax=Runella slithyformis (strain ATCC 29530 / DSM 19594 / LMG 11500 / NCIMB 11436 / LSU 4) TaxID=761193 RepID=A0A7U4E878_RUNSL|nr:hypothetical protein Runsl_5121 [Runella slithyformis DSM 19594]
MLRSTDYKLNDLTQQLFFTSLKLTQRKSSAHSRLRNYVCLLSSEIVLGKLAAFFNMAAGESRLLNMVRNIGICTTTIMNNFATLYILKIQLYFLCLLLGIVGLPLSCAFSFCLPTRADVKDQRPSFCGMNPADPVCFLYTYKKLCKKVWVGFRSTTFESLASRLYVLYFPFKDPICEERLSFGNRAGCQVLRDATALLKRLYGVLSAGYRCVNDIRAFFADAGTSRYPRQFTCFNPDESSLMDYQPILSQMLNVNTFSIR